MHLTVKILNGEECTLAASPSSLVSDVKEQVQALMSIPVADQKLIFKGKALSDGKPLRDYGVEDSCKLTLIVKPSSGKVPPRQPQAVQSQFMGMTPAAGKVESPVWDKLRSFLKRHFRDQDVESVLQEFKKEFERNLSSLSLDDIERMAATKLRQA